MSDNISTKYGSKVFTERLWDFKIDPDDMYNYYCYFKMWNNDKILKFNWINIPSCSLDFEKNITDYINKLESDYNYLLF